jgi:hypothetical protein
MASTAETDQFPPDATELATLTATKAALDAAILATVPKLGGVESDESRHVLEDRGIRS